MGPREAPYRSVPRPCLYSGRLVRGRRIREPEQVRASSCPHKPFPIGSAHLKINLTIKPIPGTSRSSITVHAKRIRLKKRLPATDEGSECRFGGVEGAQTELSTLSVCAHIIAQNA